MQLANIAVTLRRRSPWEAIDLGFAMMRNWWRPVYRAWAVSFVPFAAVVTLACQAAGTIWLATILIWWLKPVYDRMLLHVLSRAVFGEVLGPRAVLAAARQWLFTGLLAGLTVRRFDSARSFNLPVRQLEGQSGRQARARISVLARRAGKYAFWLTVVCVHFEMVFMWSEAFLLDLFLPAKAETVRDLGELLRDVSSVWSVRDVLVYAVVVSIVEPLYVAAGFALYLNRRTLLEGWDIELALRRIAESRSAADAARVSSAAIAATLVLGVFLACAMPGPAYAEAAPKDARTEMAEVLKAPELQLYRDTQRWEWKGGSWSGWPFDRPASAPDMSGFAALGYALAKATEVLLWMAAAALLFFGARWLLKALPREWLAAPEPYRPPPALFGLELAPESLPADIAGTAAAWAREGRIREALALLYRGALSDLVHRRGVELASSHTEEEVMRHARAKIAPEAGRYFTALVVMWQAAAYARRTPAPQEVEYLARDYVARFAAADA